MLSEALPGSIWNAQLLGGLMLSHGDLVIDRFSSQQAVRLLVRLLLAPRMQWQRDDLARELWPELDMTAARGRLRRTLSELRLPLKAPLGFEPFDGDRDHVRLNAPAFDIDVDRFERHVARRRWAAALAVWRGELLPGLDDDFVARARARLQELRDTALREVDPDRPGHDADDLGDDEEEEDAQRTTAPRAVTRCITPYITRFFGREAEIDRLCNAVSAHRIVTLRGTGGCGKTRLAMHAMQDMAGFDSMRFVALADCERAALLVEHVRAAFGIQSSGRPAIEQLAVRLAGQRVLLVLDNLEQLVGEELDAALETLLARLPHVHLLVTSRRSLGRADDEHVIDLAPLPTGESGAPAGGPAVALFVDRARAARGDFSLTRINAAAVADVCRRLDGLPLAIELAAAQIRRFTPREMLREIEASMKWLSRPAQRAMRDGRHGSLEAALHWSWRLLDTQARTLLGGLSAFRGGWTEAQAKAISDDADALSMLVDASLVQQADGPAARLQMLHVVREFVVERLEPAQLALARQRHRGLFGALAHALDEAHEWPALADGPNFVQAARSAWDDGDAPAAAALIQALDAHWRARGAPDELLTLLPPLAAHASLPAARRVDMLLLEAALQLNAGSSSDQPGAAASTQAASSLATLDQAMKAAGDAPLLVARVLLAQAAVQWRPYWDGPRALELLTRAEALAGDAAPPSWRAQWLMVRGAIASEHERDAGVAMAHFERAERLLQSIGDRRTSLLALPGRAACLLFSERFREAASVAAAGAKLAADLGDLKTEVQLLNRLAIAHEQLKQWDESLDVNRRELRLAHTHGLRQFLAITLWNQPMALASLGHAEDAMRLMAFANTYWLRLAAKLADDDEAWMREVRRLAEARLGAARCDALWAEGLALDDNAAIALALGRERERERGRGRS